ncbi:ParB/RepB/Spo0J family partition protein [Desulfobulbus alkaliphilus]|uniref:ParB/RepB/Spo0J family partition protein n=1 Tax=Desulfobulbus alkaliphilus TaxID=869814 RepID=UPI00196395EF|nr:ParB/RepB/Spo0J family partition protein [Desulfobulbus alkaliphilus]MBM9536695.1 ParB/RepB/Spo0J family partition protein [Desulfobulbus alkaliphilus]
MSNKNVLGRGVSALLPLEGPEEENNFFMCDIDKISPNPNQPRSYFDTEKLQELADSIREKGIIQPLLVSRGHGNRYHLIAGERRLRAARIAECEEVPVMVMDSGGPEESLELALIENIQRHDLNPIEEATAYARLINDFNLTQEDVARKVGRQRSTITNVLRLLALPRFLQDDIAQGIISEGHGRALLRIKDHPDQVQAIREKIVNEGLSVRATERLCGKKYPASPPPPARQQTSSGDQASAQLSHSYCTALTTQLTNQLNTKVRIIQQGQRGKLEIEYYSNDDLDRLVGLLSR